MDNGWSSGESKRETALSDEELDVDKNDDDHMIGEKWY